MCCRYLFCLDDNGYEEFDRLEQLFNFKYPNGMFPKGDIAPTDVCPVLIKGDKKADIELMKWGFISSKSKSPIINAREETLLDRVMFKNYISKNRCVIVASGFYEWSHDKEHIKYLFKEKDKNVIYLAGFYDNSSTMKKFVIITTESNDSISDVHSRMPVILSKEEVLTYLNDDNAFSLILKKKEPVLIRKRL